ncbi:tetratricopeptide repeat protein [Chloroflexota bacterium]
MQAENAIVTFDDAPEIEELEKVTDSWHRTEPPRGLESVSLASGIRGRGKIKHRLNTIQSNLYRSRLEVKVISWLYDFIRANIKRGRVFDLREALQAGGADCLGYAKLFTLLGRLFGLDTGIIEVVIDNKGRYVPHTAILIRLSNHRLRFVDLWYGSKNIKHKKLGLSVKQGTTWQVEDVELSALNSLEEIGYLPDHCVNAITHYIRGNRHLNQQEFDIAIRYYSKAIELYRTNARFFYNRAIAYENLGKQEKAGADYSQALSDEDAIIRILAREHDEVTSLLNLDAQGVDNLAQEIYLLRKGFTTGKEVPINVVAKRFGLPEAETTAILSSISVG